MKSFNLMAASLAVAVAFASNSLSAETYETERITVNYRITKNSHVVAGRQIPLPTVDFSFNPLKPASCGAFDLDTSLLSSFDDGTFKRMQQQVIGQLKSAFNPVGLIGTAIKRANPDLYETIMNGVFNGELNFNDAIGSCEAIQTASIDKVFGGLQDIAKTEDLSNEIEKAEQDPSSVDVTKVVKEVGSGEKGIEVLPGVFKGGVGQDAIKVVSETAKAGFNGLLGRTVTDSSPVHDVKDPITSVFSSPQEVEDYAATVVGETELRTATGSQTERKPGKGIKGEAAKRADKLYQDFTTVLNKKLALINNDDLNKLSAGQTINISIDLISMLQGFTPHQRTQYVDALVTKISFAKEVEKLLVLRRILVAGLDSTRLKDFKPSVEEHNSKVEVIDAELNMIEQELRLRNMVAGNTIENIYKAHALQQMTGTPQVSPSLGIN